MIGVQTRCYEILDAYLVELSNKNYVCATTMHVEKYINDN